MSHYQVLSEARSLLTGQIQYFQNWDYLLNQTLRMNGFDVAIVGACIKVTRP